MVGTLPPVERVLLGATALVWAGFEVRQALRRRPEAKSADRGSRVAIRLASIIAFVGAIVFKKSLPSADIGAEPLVAAIGLVIMWCGVGLRLWSFQTLGRYFTFTVQTSADQPVISAGPYGVIRHPGYAGILLALIGLGFVVDNWASLAIITVAFACGLIYRITVEEQALSRDLGDRYQSYAASRKRLVPWVW
jgi:protein-S-isoprenylcysteine O-methyltransferase Ste14